MKGTTIMAGEATIGDVYRATRPYGMTLPSFIAQNYSISLAPASDLFREEHRAEYDGKRLLSVQLTAQPGNNSRTLSETMTRLQHNGIRNNEAARAYGNLQRVYDHEIFMTQSVFGPMTADSIRGELSSYPTDKKAAALIKDNLATLDKTGFDVPVTLRTSIPKWGSPDLDKELRKFFYTANNVFAGVDLRPYLTQDGELKLYGELVQLMAAAQEQFNENHPGFEHLGLEGFVRILEQVPFPRVNLNLKNRLIFHDYQIDAARLKLERFSASPAIQQESVA